MKKNWYIVEYIGEDIKDSIVELTEEEVKAVRTFLNNQVVLYEGEYTPIIEFYADKPYDTRDEAVHAYNTGSYYK